MASSKCERVRFGDGKRGENSVVEMQRGMCACDCSEGSGGGVDWRVWVARDGIEEGLNGH